MTVPEVYSQIQDTPPDNTEYTIVILGSSTAAGSGPSTLDSAWVWRFSTYLSGMKNNYKVINLAKGGYSSINLLPTGDQERNIAKALSYHPDALIINLPSNDAAQGRSVEDQMTNYKIIAGEASKNNVPLWVTTPQPRNFDQTKVRIQKDMIDATYTMFKDFTIDLWSGFADENGRIEEKYNSGDGIHLNDLAHRIIFERIMAKNIPEYITETTHPEKQIQLKYPNGHEFFEERSKVLVQWQTNAINAIDIAYTLDNGVSWIPIATGIPASQSFFKWSLPARFSAECLIRISDSEDESLMDISDNAFNIELELANNFLVFPNPAVNDISIYVGDGSTIKRLLILDRSGRTVYEGSAGSMNTTNISPGYYLVIFQTDKKIYRSKLIMK